MMTAFFYMIEQLNFSRKQNGEKICQLQMERY